MYLCLAPIRPKNCKLNKNLCCAYCIYLESCLLEFKKTNDKIRPCDETMKDDCDYREEI